MKREEIYSVLQMLAQSQGFYGRILRTIEEQTGEDLERIWASLEAQNFTDALDIVMYFEL